MDSEMLKHTSAFTEDTFRTIMERYGQDVWNYAYFLTKNRTWSDDIVQDVFLNVYLSIDKYRGASSFKTWLFAITRNTAGNYRKSAYFRRVSLVDRVRDSEAHASAEFEAFQQIIAREIWQMVLKLPVKLREVLVLDAVHQFSIKEISEVLHIPVGTVKSRLSRARSKVSQQLGEEAAVHEREDTLLV